jgi:RNA polymerase sigma factor (sigma-70 family)
MDEPEHPDVVLLREALAGNRRARRLLVERVNPLIEARVQRSVSRARRIGINGHDDVAQQVWVRLLDRSGHRLQGFDPAKGTLEGYISRVAESELLDLLKRPKVPVTIFPKDEEAEDPTPNAEARTVAKELAFRLRVHLDDVLPMRGRLILRLLYDDERSEDEAAEIMGVSRQVVANWKHKIKTLAHEFRKKDG